MSGVLIYRGFIYEELKERYADKNIRAEQLNILYISINCIAQSMFDLNLSYL